MPAIKVENLSKSYMVGHNAAQGERYTALRDVIARNARDLARKTRDMFHGRPIIQGDSVEEFWALKDVSFEVRQGETLGIIGRNGAGKSTLLKILSRITEPTQGRITINGRVASLLEVGTGFHPELTGRENIFLNGAILGMRRGEILRKFDEIVAFAEVENFLDTPVKRYSSGMYVRLAFAVAAHLEPEILVVDEVLAVGDAAFQKKCLGKMSEISEKGRTVLFVSHNISAISRLCNRAICLDNGSLSFDGKAESTINYYDEISREGQFGNPIKENDVRKIEFNKIAVSNSKGEIGGRVTSETGFFLDIEARSRIDTNDLKVRIGIYGQDGKRLSLVESPIILDTLNTYSTKKFIVRCRISCLPLVDGRYSVNVAFTQKDTLLLGLERCAVIHVVTNNISEDIYSENLATGPLKLNPEWSIFS